MINRMALVLAISASMFCAAALALTAEAPAAIIHDVRPGKPHLASLGDDRYVVSYVSDQGLKAQRFTAGGQLLGTPISVAPTFAEASDIAADANGNFVVLWVEFDSGTTKLRMRRYDAAGTALGDVVDISSASFYNLGSASLGMAPDGRFVVVWMRGGAIDTGIPLGLCTVTVPLMTSQASLHFRLYNADGTSRSLERTAAEHVGLEIGANLACRWDLFTWLNASSDPLGDTAATVAADGSFTLVYTKSSWSGARIGGQQVVKVQSSLVRQRYSAAALLQGTNEVQSFSTAPEIGTEIAKPRLATANVGATLTWSTTRNEDGSTFLWDMNALTYDNTGKASGASQVFATGQYQLDGDYMPALAKLPAYSFIAWRQTGISGNPIPQSIELQQLNVYGSPVGAPVVAMSGGFERNGSGAGRLSAPDVAVSSNSLTQLIVSWTMNDSAGQRADLIIRPYTLP